MANYPARTFYGSPQTVINTATDIAASNFSGAPAATFDNTVDAVAPDAEEAMAMFEFPDWAAAPAAGTAISLYGIPKDVDGTDDATDAPATTLVGGGIFFTSVIIAGADALQRRMVRFNLQGQRFIDFYVFNGTAQNMNNDGGTSCVVKITPIAVGIVTV